MEINYRNLYLNDALSELRVFESANTYAELLEDSFQPAMEGVFTDKLKSIGRMIKNFFIKLFEAIKNFFARLFGKKKNNEASPEVPKVEEIEVSTPVSTANSINPSSTSLATINNQKFKSSSTALSVPRIHKEALKFLMNGIKNIEQNINTMMKCHEEYIRQTKGEASPTAENPFDLFHQITETIDEILNKLSDAITKIVDIHPDEKYFVTFNQNDLNFINDFGKRMNKSVERNLQQIEAGSNANIQNTNLQLFNTELNVIAKTTSVFMNSVMYACYNDAVAA